ncbi:MAG: methyltransferase domain-containing protein [Pseudonocardiaceae bacterium]
MSWQPHAQRLAERVTHPISRWRPIIAAVPRHVFVPRWWNWTSPGSGYGTDTFTLAEGPADQTAWLNVAYRDRSLVTQVGSLHADHADPSAQPSGMPTSSATLPGLIIQMLRHAMIDDGMDVLDVGTGSGYGTAVLATRLGDCHVTSIDVDSYLTKAATERLDGIGLRPRVVTSDATGPLSGTYDRIVATVSVRPIPASWLRALRPGGRLVTTIAGTALILTADKTDDGGATGRIEWDRAGFMRTRTGPSYPLGLHPLLEKIRDAKGDHVRTGHYPVINVVEAWELWSTLGILHPGIEHHYDKQDSTRTAFMLHSDGSWARAISQGDDPPVVHQGGPRRLWDLLDTIRTIWLRDGSLPVYGAQATITPDGTTHLSRGRWQATVA